MRWLRRNWGAFCWTMVRFHARRAYRAALAGDRLTYSYHYGARERWMERFLK